MSQLDPLPPPLPPMHATPPQPRRSASGLWVGAFLILVGAYFLLSNLGFLDWLSWDLVWPVVLIAVGLYLVVRRWR